MIYSAYLNSIILSIFITLKQNSMKKFSLKVKNIFSEHPELAWAIGIFLLAIAYFVTYVDKKVMNCLFLGVTLVVGVIGSIKFHDLEEGYYGELNMSILFSAVVVIWMLPISVYWSLIPFGFALILCIEGCFANEKKRFKKLFLVLVGFCCACLLLFLWTKECNAKQNEVERVVIEHLNKDSSLEKK